METLAWVVALWLLSLATLWCMFVGYLRYKAMGLKKKRILTADKLGSSLSEDPESLTDAEEAFREEIARARGRFEKRHQKQ